MEEFRKKVRIIQEGHEKYSFWHRKLILEVELLKSDSNYRQFFSSLSESYKKYTPFKPDIMSEYVSMDVCGMPYISSPAFI
jgi:hypothetical protein